MKIHATKTHKVDGDGFAVVVSGVPHVSRSSAVTSQNSQPQFTAMPAPNVFCCAVCEQPFSTQQALSLHYFREHEVRSVNDVKKLECRKNASSSVSGSQSGSNVPAHLPQSRIECDVCGRYFYTTASFKMHSIRSHGRKVQPVKQVSAAGEATKLVIATSADSAQAARKDKGTRSASGKQPLEKVLLAAGEKVCKSRSHSRVSADRGTGSASSATDRRYPVNSRVVKTAHKQVSKTSSKEEKCSDCGRTFVNMADHKNCAAQPLRSPQKKRKELSYQRKGQRHVEVSSAASEGIRHISQPRRFRRTSVTAKQHSGTTRKHEKRVKLQKELETLSRTCCTQSSSDDVDPLLTKLTRYHDELFSQSDNILTEKLSAEVADVLHDTSKVDDVSRAFTWSPEDEARLNRLNTQAKELQTPAKWTWTAKEIPPHYSDSKTAARDHSKGSKESETAKGVGSAQEDMLHTELVR